MPYAPLCFVLMPFGKKKDPSTQVEIDFDTIYSGAIRRAIQNVGLEAIRADEERVGGIIHKPMFERLLLCDYAIADLTTANANVFYELGVRHAVRPATTVAVFAESQRIPFDLNFLRGLPYGLEPSGNVSAAQLSKLERDLTKRLQDLRDHADPPEVDSPLFQLLLDYKAPDIAHIKTDVFRECAAYSERMRSRLSEARRSWRLGDAYHSKAEQEVLDLEHELGDLKDIEIGLLADLFMTWRDFMRYDRMIDLFNNFPTEMKRSVMIREQYSFALNRLERSTEALSVLEEVLKQNGPSSETFGLTGRVYKDMWTKARQAGDKLLASAYLNKAIEAYVSGLEADSRDPYPGINAVTLLDVRGDATSLLRKSELLPVVRYAVQQRLKSKGPNYWDHATMLELEVLRDRETEAVSEFTNALATNPNVWELGTTLNNLRLIGEARESRGDHQGWRSDLILELERRAAGKAAVG